MRPLLLRYPERVTRMDTIMYQLDSLLVKQAFSRLASETSIVTLIDQDQVKMGLTVTAVTSVSLEPPLVLVCVYNHSRTSASGQYATSVLPRSVQYISMVMPAECRFTPTACRDSHLSR